jgi:hypothetical protein
MGSKDRMELGSIMLIQHTGNYKLAVEVQWLDLNQIRVAVRRTDLGIEYTDQEYYLTPQELSKLADYIRDVLAE